MHVRSIALSSTLLCLLALAATGCSCGDGAIPDSDAGPTDGGGTTMDVGPLPAVDAATTPDATGADAGSEIPPSCDTGDPLTVPDDTWTTVLVPGTACGNAGEAGFVVNPSPASDSLLVYFQGGGACFNEADCRASNLGGFTEAQGVAMASGRTLFDRADASNPFRDWDFVFVPYCTGDFHSGGHVASYGTRHVGHDNLEAFLARIVPTFCDADRVVVTGTSAGGFGSTFAYVRIHELFGSLPVDLIADSGPYMTPDYMPEAMQAMFDANWGFRANMPADCADCRTRWDALYTYIAQRWPDDRMSFISYTRDPSIRGRFSPYAPLDDLDTYEVALNALVDEVLVPLPNFRVFLVEAQDHVLLNGPLARAQGGTTLGEFIDQQLTDDPTWASVRP